ncbi:MAG: AAA family ATPase, partial [Hyphomicrobiales bacterium]|nr:AAA family ATPase [Hyphomicrobiales bacterium]
IVRASGGGRRGGARALTPFVGREEELSLLSRRWERARAGEGRLVLIVGEPGLGKSRLIGEFHARLAETPHTWTGMGRVAALTEHAAASNRGRGPAAIWR